jgi:tryptophan synthase alpha chain
MTYYNPVLAFGLKSFARTAADAGADGVIVPDLPYEECEPLRAETEAAGLDMIQLVAPTSTPARVKTIARLSRGFVYVVSLTGITGERRGLPKDLDVQIRALRLVSTKPVCVGFGVSTPEQVAAVGKVADGVVVGSAIVRTIEAHTGTSVLIDKVGDLIATLKDPLRASSSAGSARAVLGGGTEERAARRATTVGRGAKPPSEGC